MTHSRLPKRPHVVFILSDQQTWIQNWDPNWAKNELPAMQRLMANGMTFEKGFCNSCTCSPSRTTLFTGTYPAHHKVTEVLGCNNPSSMEQIMQNILASGYQNMAKMMEDIGYHVAYKGKWHLTKPVNYIDNSDYQVSDNAPIDQLYWTKEDVGHIADKWRFNDWNYPDAGDDMELINFGGGTVNNDGRFVDGNGQSAWYGDDIPIEERVEASAVEFIRNYEKNHGDKPLFLVVSLVNPHDVLSYPGLTSTSATDGPLYQQAGYQDSDFDTIPVKLPLTVNEDLSTKPKVQTVWKAVCQANGPIQNEDKATKYVQFYAYLTSLVDKEINKVLNALDDAGMTNDTLIVRTSDHGDMSMAHGMQRQKMYNVYRETLNVPMIFSNPVLFPNPVKTTSMAGLIDLMPTIADITGVPKDKWIFQGTSLVPVLENPETEVQDFMHFTYDDTYLTTPDLARMGPMYIRCIHNKKWKYAVYFDPHFGQPAEYEMYDLENDWLEARNLAHERYSAGYEEQRQLLHQQLTHIMLEKGTMPDTIAWPKVSGGMVLNK